MCLGREAEGGGRREKACVLNGCQGGEGWPRLQPAVCLHLRETRVGPGDMAGLPASSPLKKMARRETKRRVTGDRAHIHFLNG